KGAEQALLRLLHTIQFSKTGRAFPMPILLLANLFCQFVGREIRSSAGSPTLKCGHLTAERPRIVGSPGFVVDVRHSRFLVLSVYETPSAKFPNSPARDPHHTASVRDDLDCGIRTGATRVAERRSPAPFRRRNGWIY
ncbi:MAG TPA: hypothetical protein P5055_05165, partial [Candidatus Paceibacterota bacterium]|nr:hypothetical protein [Candidatus Paceibacterota bacterium]